MATVTIRQAGVTRAQAGALLTHEYRATLAKEGRVTTHDNEGIDPARTRLNKDYIFVDGVPRLLKSVGQIHKELDRRLEKASGTRTHADGSTTKVALRKDAKVLRNFIVQLDPEETGEVAEWLKKPEAEKVRDTSLMFNTLIRGHIGEVYGIHNLLSMTLHLDEKSPHIHLMVTPIDSEGRVRQASFIDGKQAMRDFWQRGREKLREAGYEADLVAGDLRPHESLRAFKTRTAKAKEEAKEAEKARAEQEAKAKARMEAQKAQYDQQIGQMEAHKKALEAETEEAESVHEEAFTIKDALTAENERLTAENKALEAQKARWDKENGDFLEAWYKGRKGLLLGGLSEENRQMLREAMSYREEAQEKLAEAEKAKAQAEATLEEAKDIESRTSKYVAANGQKIIASRVEAQVGKARRELWEERQEVTKRENAVISRESAISEKEQALAQEARKVRGDLERLESLKAYKGLSLSDREEVLALVGYYAHTASRKDIDERNKNLAHIENYKMVEPYRARLTEHQLASHMGKALEVYKRGGEGNGYTELRAKYHRPNPTQSRDFSL